MQNVEHQFFGAGLIAILHAFKNDMHDRPKRVKGCFVALYLIIAPFSTSLSLLFGFLMAHTTSVT